MTAANNKNLEAAYHKWQRKILGITWKEMITNEDSQEVRKSTGMDKMENKLRKKRIRWGHLHQMEDNMIPKQALRRSSGNGPRKRGSQRKSWKDKQQTTSRF